MPLYLNQMSSVFFCVVILLVFRKKDISSILCCLFVYGTFYFFSSIFVVFGNDSAEPIVSLHITGMGAFVRAVTVLFLLYMGFRIYRLRIHTDSSVISVYALSIALMAIGATTQLFAHGFTALQYSNVISLFLMLSLIVFGAGAWKASELRGRLSNSFVVMMVLLVFFSVVIAFFEVYTGKAWATFFNSSGQKVIRASSFLFNPNLYAMWCGCAIIFFSYLYHSRKSDEHSSLFLVGVFIAGVGVFLSSSRGFCYLIVVALFLSLVLLRGRRGVKVVLPFLLFLGALSFCYILTHLIAWSRDGSGEDSDSFMVLADRLVSAPVQLIIYSLEHFFHVSASALSWLSAYAPPSEFNTAFVGRFNGELRDSGILVILDDMGGFGLSGFVVFFLFLFAQAVREYLASFSVEAVYALLFIFYSLAIGFLMRYQAFPVWVFVAVILCPCLGMTRTLLRKEVPVTP